MGKVVLFDGECNFCDGSVQFIIKRDPDKVFSFASLQSEEGKRLVEKSGIPLGTDSMILVEEDGSSHMKSGAALRIVRELRRPWNLLWVFILIPYPLRDGVYNIIARNRIKWFGKRAACRVPTAEERERFLDF
ncbi:thiol-disulfide oxidoreductase DCC family protein [Bacillus sp. H-16]|uniref:DCC1-like thiol-disulfide oxidoreductase family protein n=1 Tax=Alteribacter salitolerans TaxID=2912333 RepID=UPI001962CAB5|nr:thiol-disulfide oxidoreductase DCC family protein [Alteribacter salitolerans]